MVRTQIQLTESQSRRLRGAARRQGISLAEVVRRLIDVSLTGEESDRKQRYQRAAVAVGRFADRGGARDGAREHDRYLDEEGFGLPA